MIDIELLKLAAKAAGIELEYPIFNFGELSYFQLKGYPIRHWNPLRYKGDTFSMCARLHIHVSQKFGIAEAKYPLPEPDESFNTHKILVEAALPDEYETCYAACRVAVRAAAAIGKAMP